MTAALLLLLGVIIITCGSCVGEDDIFNTNKQPDRVLKSADGRIRGFSHTTGTDIVLGLITPVHKPDGIKCTNDIFISQMLDYVETFLYCIDVINNDSRLLPGITLGYDIRDSCISESTAIEEIVDMVILSDTDRCQVCNDMEEGDSNQLNDTAPNSLIGIIGSYASFVSIPVANFLRIFTVPQVSPFSTSPLLSNREQYSYFYRTVPPDDQQAQAMIDILIHYGWTYASVIHSNDLYGDPGADRLVELVQVNDICIDLNIGISIDFTDLQYDVIVNRIHNSTAKVIIFFSSYNEVIRLFDRMLLLQSSTPRRFLWIASDAWIELVPVLSKYDSIVSGIWGVIPRTNPEPKFYSYFSKLTPLNNNRNPWYIEFYREFYGMNASSTAPITSHPNHRNYSFTPFVIDAVYTFAHAINNFVNMSCPKPIMWNATSKTCVGSDIVPNGAVLREYLANTSFTSPTGNNIVLEKDTGSLIGVYRILNNQLNNISNGHELVTIGEWDGTKVNGPKLVIDQTKVLQFGMTQDGRPQYEAVQSQCQRCSSGTFAVKIPSSCCGICTPCVGQQYVPYSNSSQCLNCSDETWGNNPLKGSDSCVPITESYLDPSDIWGIFLIILAFIGLVTVVFVTIVFLCYWNTPIVKASGREQMVLLLIGIALCFFSATFFLIKPSIPICLLQRISLWLFLSLILSSLFVKLVRIARIFLRNNTSGRPVFIGPLSQILFTFLLLSVQCVLVLISLLVTHPESERVLELNSQDTNGHPTILVRCQSPHTALIVLQMLYFSVLLVVCNGLAMLTIRFPANFKEVIYVALSSFCVGIIWIAFIITYFATSSEFQTAIISFAIQMSAFAVLVCMFGPRVVIMIFMPQKNVIQLSTIKTSTNFGHSNNITTKMEGK